MKTHEFTKKKKKKNLFKDRKKIRNVILYTIYYIQQRVAGFLCPEIQNSGLNGEKTILDLN